MPGINLIHAVNNDLTEREEKILRAFDNIIYDERSFREMFFKTSTCVMGCVRYEEYPVNHFDTDDFIIKLEGRIYNRGLSDVQQTLLGFAQAAFIRHEPIAEQITKWILQTDGDYVVYIIQRSTGECLIFNDLWGRLPLYYTRQGQQTYVARDLRFITNLLPTVSFDRVSIAQFLILNYSVGERTIYEGIYRVPQATMLHLSANGYVAKTLYIHNFEVKDNRGRTPEQNASELAARFTQALTNRLVPGYTNILSMSGGFDSRAVAAAVHRLKVPFHGATFLDFSKSSLPDVIVAEKLANALNIPWSKIELGGIKGEDVLHLLRMTSGISPLVLSVILPFFEKLRENWGTKLLYFTGDGGDKAMPDLRPLYSLRTMNDLIHYTLYRHQHFNPGQAAMLTGLTEHEISDSLREHFESFPEKSLDYRFVHQMVYDRSFKWLFASEDRNRNYFWTSTPFFANDFFLFSMSCSDEQKAFRQLYGRFLHELAPEVLSVEDQNSGQQINSWNYRSRQRVKNNLIRVAMLSPEIMHKSKQLAGRIKIYPQDAPIRACLKDQLRDCKAISDVLSPPAVKAVIEDNSIYSKACLHHLLTMTSAIEDMSGNQSSIKKYFGINLI